MRQLGDMLVWLGLIVVVAAVVYFTPRIANYVASEQPDRARETHASRVMAYQNFGYSDPTP
jgi:hypothetical protein